MKLIKNVVAVISNDDAVVRNVVVTINVVAVIVNVVAGRDSRRGCPAGGSSRQGQYPGQSIYWTSGNVSILCTPEIEHTVAPR